MQTATTTPTLQTIPLKQIQESPSNPRRAFGDLTELAASIAAEGVLQPVLVRPDKKGFELVFGARRFRASKIAGLDAIPAIVRTMDDVEVLEAQLVENCQRADVHPMEEAVGYERLHLEYKKTVDEIAAKVGKSRAFVYGRMKLLELSPAAREACLEDKITASHAILLARMPRKEMQDEVLERVLDGHPYDMADPPTPLSVRELRDLIEDDFMLRLADAPFQANDAELLPEAGACTACPKRTGNQRELFEDVAHADVCTDPPCFQAKKEALWKRTAAAAKADGKSVLGKGEVAKVFSKHGSISSLDGKRAPVKHDAAYVPLDEVCPQDPKGRTYAELLGENTPAVYVAKDPVSQAPRELVRKEDVAAALKGSGVKVKVPKPADPNKLHKEAVAREKSEAERELRDKVAAAAVKAVAVAAAARKPDRGLWRLLAGFLVPQGSQTAAELVPGAKAWHVPPAALDKLGEDELRAVAIAAALGPDASQGFSSGYEKDLLAACKYFKVDLKALERTTALEMATPAPGKEKKAAKKKGGAK